VLNILTLNDTSCDCRVHVLTIFMPLVSCNLAVLLPQCFVIVRELFKFYDLGLVVFGLECK
jgi:Na+-transporting NADH:ubiquinone oxidoreductase subunit NqrE